MSENAPPIPPAGPPFSAEFEANRPSKYWMANPAWIDGARTPALHFTSNEHIAQTLKYYRDYPAPTSPTPPSTPLVNAGHLCFVVMVFTPAPVLSARGAKAAVKQKKETKMEYIRVESMSRTEFQKAFLAVHGLENTYSPGIHSGFPFKMWWTGANGGKAGAPTIMNDHQYSVAMEALMTKSKSKVQVSVEFDIDAMVGFRISNPTELLAGSQTAPAEDELLYGTRVPNVDTFSDISQLHGNYILQLKNKWPCAEHRGEHGDTGHCYITSTGEHIRLNNRRFKLWSAAWAAGDATKHEPPNIPEFDGARDGRISNVKARGRSGPYSSQALSSSGDANSLLMAALLPLLGGLSRKRSRSPSPKHATPQASPPASPMPASGAELRSCLSDFAATKGVDMTASEDALMALDLTPDIIPSIPVDRLTKVTGAVEGRVLKLQAFCTEWQARLEAKKNRQAEKRPRLA
ncbi:hypothetical protein B0H13DRAFT_2240520 [Mycena leptocephala]|nr:hypothetical protein B0H13DRAFT_2240520 [Mycena leptocephala]